MRHPGIVAVVAVVLITLTGCVPGPDAEPTRPSGPSDCAPLKNMAIAAWAEYAGLVPEDRSLSRWIEENPDSSSFAPLPADEPLDVVTLWEQRDRQPQRWNDLVRYMQNEGEPWLLETKLDTSFPVIDDQAPDPFGWRSCG